MAFKLLGENLDDKNNFVNEARILQELQHFNIVKFQGICIAPLALILVYVYFDFHPFGINSKGSSLVNFLATLNDFDCEGFDSSLRHCDWYAIPAPLVFKILL